MEYQLPPLQNPLWVPRFERLSAHFSFAFLQTNKVRAYKLPLHWNLLGFGPARFTFYGLIRLTHLHIHHSVIFAPVKVAPIVESMLTITHVTFPFMEDAPLAVRIAANILNSNACS
jgi:hypothetical protein